MKKSRIFVPLIYASSLLFCLAFQSCREEEDLVSGSYLEIESGYKNCGTGLFNNQVEVLSDRGICWRWGGNPFSECFTKTLTLTPEFTFMETSSGIKYFDDGSQEDGLQSESIGTYAHEGDFINLYEETRFGTDTTILRIEMDGTLNTMDETLANCELHGLYRKQNKIGDPPTREVLHNRFMAYRKEMLQATAVADYCTKTLLKSPSYRTV